MKKQFSFLKLTTLTLVAIAIIACSDEDYVGAEPIITNSAMEELNLPDKINDEQIFTVVEKNPEFKGGVSEMYKYIAEHMTYPAEAQERGLEGRVFIKFIVDKNGDIQNPVILKGTAPSLDAEALRIISDLPQWNPGMQDGEPVNTYFTMPIAFRLE